MSPVHRTMMRRRRARVLLTTGAILGLLAIAARIAERRTSTPRPPAVRSHPAPQAAPAFDRVVVENFRLGAPECGPFPLVALGVGRIAQPRLGGFRLGLGHVLELDRLELNLPLNDQAPVTNAEGRVDAAPGVTALLTRMLDVQSLRQCAHVATPFTGLSVHGLHICLVGGTNRIAVLTASTARLTGKEWSLTHCCFLAEDLQQVEVSQARLSHANGWRIVGEHGQTADLEAVATVLRRLLLEPSPPRR